MDLTIDVRDGMLSAVLSGKFTFDDNRRFKDVLDMVDQQAVRQVSLDLSRLEHVDSAALGMMLLLRKKVQEKGGTVILRNPQGMVQRTLDLAKFGEMFVLS